MIKSEFQQWLKHPATEALISNLKEQIQFLKDGWAEGAFTTETVDGTVQTNAKNIGQIQCALTLLEGISSGDFLEITENDES